MDSTKVDMGQPKDVFENHKPGAPMVLATTMGDGDDYGDDNGYDGCDNGHDDVYGNGGDNGCNQGDCHGYGDAREHRNNDGHANGDDHDHVHFK